MKKLVIVVLLVCTGSMLAETAIPHGTILPVELNSGLNSGRNTVGQVISARIRQDVPLPGGTKIHEGTKVLGRVVAVKSASNAGKGMLALRFDTVVIGHRKIAVTTNIRALASPMEAWDAQLPLTGPDRGTPENAWTTVQVGGDEAAYRGGGPVARGTEVVGEPTFNGVLARTSAKDGTRCQGEDGGAGEPQALWVFSSDACGVYGFENLTIVHAGRSDPLGEVILESNHGEARVGKGSGILLRVRSSTEP
jgi:hypothetical protein